jgi:GT2 family glycosyltransferase
MFMQSSPVVSVIIVVWNSKAYLSTCLNKLVRQTFQDFEVILIDNGSNDSALEELEEGYPSLRLIIKRLESNHGFAAANNIGARLAHGRWLALLNADAFPEPDWLENLIKSVEDYPEYSCFSSRQIQANTPELLDGTGDSYHVSGMAWRRNIDYPSNQFGRRIEEIFSPCAAAALYLREAFLKAGGFDEDFFSYFEDVDLGFRLRLHGHRALYVPAAVVHHVGSVTFGMNSDFSLYHSHRNLVWTFFKNMPTRLFLKYLPAHIFANLMYLLYYTISGRGKVLWKAKWDAIYNLSLFLGKRKEIQKARTATDAELLSSMERGWLEVYIHGFRHQQVLAQQSKK